MPRSSTWLIASGLTLGACLFGCNQADDVVALAPVASNGDAGLPSAGGGVDAGKTDARTCDLIVGTSFYLNQITGMECRMPSPQEDPKAWTFLLIFVTNPQNQPGLPETRMPDMCDARPSPNQAYGPFYPLANGGWVLCPAYCDAARRWLANDANVKAVRNCLVAPSHS